MDDQEPQFLEVGDGEKCRRIAYRFEEGEGDTAIVWLSGFLSDMAGTKVAVLSDWARAQGHAMLRFDYSGHGLSPGDMLQASIGDWLEEASAMIELIKNNKIVIVGSSMGGWIALLIARALAKTGDTRLAGLVLIAPAWDMTEKLMWERMAPKTRAIVETEGVFYAPSDYDEPYPLTKTLIEEGRNHLVGDGKIEVAVPVRILQGLRDPDVPWQHALKLVDLIVDNDVELTLVKNGDHRLSEPQDLRRLEATVASLVEMSTSRAE